MRVGRAGARRVSSPCDLSFFCKAPGRFATSTLSPPPPLHFPTPFAQASQKRPFRPFKNQTFPLPATKAASEAAHGTRKNRPGRRPDKCYTNLTPNWLQILDRNPECARSLGALSEEICSSSFLVASLSTRASARAAGSLAPTLFRRGEAACQREGRSIGRLREASQENGGWPMLLTLSFKLKPEICRTSLKSRSNKSHKPKY